MIDVSTAFIIIAIVAAAEALGWLAQKIGQPKVLGELATGLVLGGSMLGILDPSNPVIASLSEIGLLVLLFGIGLHTDVRELTRVGPTALIVGAVGVVAPFALGFGVALAFKLTMVQAIVCGAALTATSIGISARVLSDLGKIESIEGRVVLGAAVLDDVIGLGILALVSALATPSGGAEGGGGGSGNIGHSVAMLGAFGLGMALYRTRFRNGSERVSNVLGFIVVPIFFAAVGAAVQFTALGGTHAILLFAALLVVGVAGKFVAGYAPRNFQGNRALVGLAMVPRGEVGLVFATTALAAGLFDTTLFSIMTLVVMATTFLTPPILTRVAARSPSS